MPEPRQKSEFFRKSCFCCLAVLPHDRVATRWVGRLIGGEPLSLIKHDVWRFATSLFDYFYRDDVPITTRPGPTELSAVEASPGDGQIGAGLSAKAETDTADMVVAMVVAMKASPALGEVPVRLFVSPEDLFALNELGALLRLGNFQNENTRFVAKEGGRIGRKGDWALVRFRMCCTSLVFRTPCR